MLHHPATHAGGNLQQGAGQEQPVLKVGVLGRAETEGPPPRKLPTEPGFNLQTSCFELPMQHCTIFACGPGSLH